MVKKRFNLKTIVPLFIAVIFISSVLVVFGTSSKAKDSAQVTVDLGAYAQQPYRDNIPIGENATALDALSGFSGISFELEDGSLRCIADYCNTNQSVWRAYRVENNMEYPIEERLENYDVSNGDSILFRYELR